MVMTTPPSGTPSGARSPDAEAAATRAAAVDTSLEPSVTNGEVATDHGNGNGHGGAVHDVTRPTPSPVIVTEGRTWGRAVAIGIAAFIVSRLCMLAGAGVRAAQVTVDAHDNLEPVPGSPWGLVSGVFTQWDGLWYMEIVRNGYPTAIPPNVTYFQLEARAAFFPLFPMVAKAVDLSLIHI